MDKQISLQVMEFVGRNDFVNLNRLLSILKNINMETVDQNGNTPLLLACFLGHKNIVQILISLNVNLKAINFFGQNALTLATYSGSLDIIKMLLELRSYKDFSLSSMVPPLIVAMLQDNEILIKIFSKLESDAQAVRTVHGLTPKTLTTIKRFASNYN